LVKNGSVGSFSHSILFRSIWHSWLKANAPLSTELFELVSPVFSAVIEAEGFRIFAILSVNGSDKILNMNLCISLLPKC